MASAPPALRQESLPDGTGGAPGPSDASRRRIGFLDGIRGLAALSVAAAHALLVNQPVRGALTGDVWTEQEPVNTILRLIFTVSHQAVVAFIVLSGCSLMLPVVARDGRLPKGVRDYFRRRMRRILPPYYAALGLSLALTVTVPGMGAGLVPWWGEPNPSSDVVLSHLLLVQNWSPDWADAISPPLWSIPVEWQIYFVFPLILLPVWRRYGGIAAIGVGFAIGLGLYAVVGSQRLVLSAPWFIGLFAIGMVAADLGFSTRARSTDYGRLAVRVAWMGLTGFVIASATLFVTDLPFRANSWLVDPFFGVAAAAVIVWAAVGGRPSQPLVVRVLSSRPMTELGWFSYSLYLVHAPILVLVATVTRELVHSPLGYAVAVSIGLVAALMASYVFHLAIERPFMPPRSAARLATSSTLRK